jgi:hypothetical protein
MAAPILPIALTALRVGAVAAVAVAAIRNRKTEPKDMHRHHAMEDLPEGVEVSSRRGEGEGTARLKRTIRLGKTGPGVEIDLAALTRIRIRRV